MSASNMNIYEKLIEGYVKAPPSLKGQAITALAIQLCQNFELKKDIIFESELLRLHKHSILNSTWENLIKKRSTEMCQKLPLPLALKNLLIVRIRLIALQLFSWNRRQVAIFNFSPLFADSLLTLSDWTVEMRLDSKQIAERLVQDERIPVCQRYRMACMYCIELFIPSLWNQITPQQRNDSLHFNEWKLIRFWSRQLAGGVEEIIEYNLQFWNNLIIYGLINGLRSVVFYCWDKLNENLKQNVITFAKLVVFQIYRRKIREEITRDFLPHYKSLSTLVHFIDILCFLLTQMSKKQRVIFFQKALQGAKHNVLVCFLQWPYLDFLIPLIEELWSILHESKYGDLLLTLANHYLNENGHNTISNDYMDYYYVDLMVELLRKTPDRFKRYVFSNNYLTGTNIAKEGELLFTMINKKPLTIRNIKIFQNILKHVTLEEKQSFLRSKYGELLCCHLALEEEWELLNSILRKCFPNHEIARFKKKLLVSKSGKESCFQMLTRVNENSLNSWLNWGFSSEQENFPFIFKIFFRDQRLDFKNVSDFQYIIEIDCLENILKRYAPSQDATKKFKSMFVKIYSRDMCISFVTHTKWIEVDRFLSWAFPSEDARKRYKKWFVKTYAMYICEYHISHSNLQDAEQFLTWCFPMVTAIEQFKQELFISSGLKIPWVLLSRNSQDLDSLIKWFRLSPEALVMFKREVLFCSKSLSTIFDLLPLLEKYPIIKPSYVNELLRRDEKFLRWGLKDKKNVMDFKEVSDNYLSRLPFPNVRVRLSVQIMWNKLISEISSCVLTEQNNELMRSIDTTVEIWRSSDRYLESMKLIDMSLEIRKSINRDLESMRSTEYNKIRRQKLILVVISSITIASIFAVNKYLRR